MKTFINELKQTGIFYEFTREQLELIAGICEQADFDEGELIFSENSDCTDLYVVTRGQVDILFHPAIGPDRKPGEEMTIAALIAGQSFGEVALVDQGLRSASARAAAKGTRLLLLPRDKLLLLCQTHPRLGFQLMYNLATDLALKMRRADLRLREQLLYQPVRRG